VGGREELKGSKCTEIVLKERGQPLVHKWAGEKEFKVKVHACKSKNQIWRGKEIIIN